MMPIDIALYGYGFGYGLLALLIPLALWSYFWKIIGLWFSAKNNEKGWFVVFVFINLVGMLEIYYLHSRKNWPFKK